MENDETQNKFLDRFIAFFLVEQRIRLKVYLISVGITFIYALAARFLFHASDRTVAIQASSLLCALIGMLVSRYLIVGHVLRSDTRSVNDRFRVNWKIALIGATALACVAVAAQTNIPTLQAITVNLKLDFLTARLDAVSAASIPESELKDQFQKIQTTVNSIPRQVPVKPADLQKTQSAILRSLKVRSVSEQTKEAGWSAAVDLSSFAAKRLVGPRTQSPPVGYPLNSPLILKDTNVTILGGPSVLYLGAPIIVEHSTLVFTKIDFIGTGTSEAIVILGDNSLVLIQDAIVKNVPQRIDPIVWNEVRFENVPLEYGGGRIRMQNVTFKDCNVIRLATNPATFELANRISAAEESGQPVTYAYDP